MKVMKWSAIALAISAATSQLAMAEAFVSDQAESKGFLEDSHLTITNKMAYFNRMTGGDGHDAKARNARDPRDATWGILANYESGFTQGTVGFGIDAFGYLSLKLDGGDGHPGSGYTQVDDHGKLNDDFGKAGGAVKVRVSKTELKYGDMQPTAPVFAAGGTRLIPQVATGFNLLSSEIAGLDLEAGRFTSSSGVTSTNRDGEIWATYANKQTNAASFIGGKYAFTDNASVALYGAEFEDLWRQYYLNANYTLPLADNQSLGFDFNIYRTNDEGKADAGEISNTTYSLAAAYTFSAHTFTLSYQKVHGDEPFDYVGFGNNGAGDGGDSIFLANSVQWSDFNGPGEKSWQARYDLNMAEYGVPGLSFMVRYIHGDDIDGTKADPNGAYAGNYGEDDSEHETNVEAKYVIQEGPAKDLSFRIRQAFHYGDDSTGGRQNEFRLIAEYPLSIM
ncbi:MULTISPECIES: OprD family porin [Pseudomonas]|uniref:OprD family porin n=1 Tax=Pseudomonas TaxID=286 RepID=UPI000852B3F9|nr:MULTISPECIES: OprD family porin [Pseudomonas]GLU40689.1 porin D [Pseudomonas sp. NBRC 100443]